MKDEIINRVSNSKLITFDLEELYPVGKRIIFDIKDWLFEEIILKENDFRATLNTHDWSQYKDTYIALTCSSDAIIPSWAFMLVTTKLVPFAKKVVVGNSVLLETVLFEAMIHQIDVSAFENKPVIIKGCAHKPIPESAYALLIQKLQPVTTSLLFGEACSTVPLYKRQK